MLVFCRLTTWGVNLRLRIEKVQGVSLVIICLSMNLLGILLWIQEDWRWKSLTGDSEILCKISWSRKTLKLKDWGGIRGTLSSSQRKKGGQVIFESATHTRKVQRMCAESLQSVSQNCSLIRKRHNLFTKVQRVAASWLCRSTREGRIHLFAHFTPFQGFLFKYF